MTDSKAAFIFIFYALSLVLLALYSSWPFFSINSGGYERIFALYPAVILIEIVIIFYSVIRAKKWLAVVSLGLAGLSITTLASEASTDVSCEAGGQVQISVLSHNLAASNERPEATLRALLEVNADILLLQEAGGSVEPYLLMLDRQYPYHSVCERGCDLRIYSRLPIDRVRWRLKNKLGALTGPHIMWTQVTPPGPPLLLATVHMARDAPSAERDQERRRLMDFIRSDKSGRLIVAGDFNLTPWEYGMRELDAGIAPARRVTRALFSFPSRIGPLEHVPPFLPIDHIIVGAGLSVTSTTRLSPTGSDHFPIMARLVVSHDTNRSPFPAARKNSLNCNE